MQAGGAQGQIEDAFFGAPSYGFGVEQEQVGGVALAQKASVFQTQNFGRLSRELMHSLGHAHGAHFSGPVAQQMQTKTCVVEKCEVGACVTERNQAVRVIEQLGHSFGFAVEQHGCEHGAQIFIQGQVKCKVEGVYAFLQGQAGHALLFIFLVLGFEGFNHMDLFPFVVEQAKGRRLQQLMFDLGPEFRAGQTNFQGIVLQTQSRLPVDEPFDRISRSKCEVHAQGAA